MPKEQKQEGTFLNRMLDFLDFSYCRAESAVRHGRTGSVKNKG